MVQSFCIFNLPKSAIATILRHPLKEPGKHITYNFLMRYLQKITTLP